jgi:hypothetical protein
LEELQLIKILKEDVPPKSNLSDKYRGVFSKKDAQNFNEYTMKMRKEWGNT